MTKKELRNVQIGGTTIVEYRPGKFLQITNGFVVSHMQENMVFRVIQSEYKKRFGTLETGMLGLCFALCALSIIFTTVKIETFFPLINQIIHISALIAFFLSSYAGGRLYYTFLLIKFPRFALHTSRSVDNIPAYYLRLLMLYVLGAEKATEMMGYEIDTHEIETEIGYLSILGAFFFLWIGIVLWIMFTLAAEFGFSSLIPDIPWFDFLP